MRKRDIRGNPGVKYDIKIATSILVDERFAPRLVRWGGGGVGGGA